MCSAYLSLIISCLALVFTFCSLGCNQKDLTAEKEANNLTEKKDSSGIEYRPINFIPIDSTKLPMSISYRGISIVNDTTVWISGSKGTIIRTLNGGIDWDTLKILQENSTELRSIVAFNKDIAITANIESPGRIYKTIDGGKHWKIVYQNNDSLMFINALAFWNDSVGLAFGDPIDNHSFILKTTDGGNSWHNISNRLSPLAGFAASNTSIALQDNGKAWIGTGGDKSVVFHSSNYGQTWIEQQTPFPKGAPEKGIYSIAFKDSLRGIIVGSDYTQTNGDSTFAYTNDGGDTWLLNDTEDSLGYRSCVAYGPSAYNFIISCGTYGTMVSYNSSGMLPLVLNQLNLNVVTFLKTGKTGWAAGNMGRIYKIAL